MTADLSSRNFQGGSFIRVSEQGEQIDNRASVLEEETVTQKVSQRAIEIFKALTPPAIVGYALYGAGRLIFKIPSLAFLKPEGFAPTPIIMLLIAKPLGSEVKLTISKVALAIIGDRHRYGQFPLEKGRVASLRHHAWKIIDSIEGIPAKIDIFVSYKIFHIRTERDLKEHQIPDYDLSFLEIIRRCLIDQAAAFWQESFSMHLGMHIIQKVGFSVLFSSVQWSLEGLKQLSEFLNRVNALCEIRERALDNMMHFNELPQIDEVYTAPT